MFYLHIRESNGSASLALLMEQKFSSFYLVILNTEIGVPGQNCMLHKVEIAFWWKDVAILNTDRSPEWLWSL